MCANRTKYDKLFAAYEKFTKSICEVDDPIVAAICSSWESAKANYGQAVESGVRKSQIAQGIEQGLREMPMMMSMVEKEKRERVLAILRVSLDDTFPEFFKQDATLLAAVIQRSKIRNEREYYLVRHRIDQLEGEADVPTELALLYQLVDEFEA